MARIRTIKPEFFTNEDVARLPPLYRLAFEGLWCHADKAGRLEDRPARLKVLILPYDDVDFDEALQAMAAAKFVRRYIGSDGKAYIQVRTFDKHQRPRPDEPESVIPEPSTDTGSDYERYRDRDGSVPAESLGKERKGTGREGSLLRTPSAQPTDDALPLEPRAARFDAEALVSLWNELVTAPVPTVTKLTADRRTKFNARLRTFPEPETWRTVIGWLNQQDWCRAPGSGNNPNWTATLDWLCKNDSNVQRWLEKAQAERERDRRQPGPRPVDPVKAKYAHFPTVASR